MITICPECGHQLSDQATRCPECGCPITRQPHSGTSSDSSDSSKSGERYQYRYHYTPKKNKGCRNCLITLLIVLLLGLICLGCIIYGCFGLTSEVVSQLDNHNTTTIQSEDTTERETSYSPTDEADADSTDTLSNLSSHKTADREDKEKTTLFGYIGGSTYPISMTLSFTPEGDVSGQYIYTNQKNATPIALLGNYQPPYLTLYESSPSDSTASAYFEGKYDGESFAGSYTNRGGQEYAFTLKQEQKP